MEEGGGCVLEWCIYNFGCWNRDIHGVVISSPKSDIFSGLNIQLYPRGYSGRGDFLEVRPSGNYKWSSSDDASYFRPDGSLICMLQVDPNSLDLPHGPKFDEVLAQIRKNESFHEEHLTLKLRVKKGDPLVEYMCTTIDAFDFVVKIPTSEDWTRFIDVKNLTYPIDEGGTGGLVFLCNKNQQDELALTLRPHRFEKDVLVLTRLTAVNGEAVTVHENEWFFRDECAWTFFKLSTREKNSPILNLKIIPGHKPKNSLGFRMTPPHAKNPGLAIK